jgi:hypothetical protein
MQPLIYVYIIQVISTQINNLNTNFKFNYNLTLFMRLTFFFEKKLLIRESNLLLGWNNYENKITKKNFKILMIYFNYKTLISY